MDKDFIIVINIIVIIIMSLILLSLDNMNTDQFNKIQSQLNTIQLQSALCVPPWYKEKDPNLMDKEN